MAGALHIENRPTWSGNKYFGTTNRPFQLLLLASNDG
jgi:hypothetical protein